MNQHSSLLSIFLTFQPRLDELPCLLKYLQQILVVDIINLDAQVLVLLPVVKVFEIILQDRDDVGDARLFKSVPPTQGEDSVSFVSADFLNIGSERPRKQTA